MVLSADGVASSEIMRVAARPACVGRWQQRFMEAGGYDAILAFGETLATQGLLVDKTVRRAFCP